MATSGIQRLKAKDILAICRKLLQQRWDDVITQEELDRKLDELSRGKKKQDEQFLFD